MSSSNKKHLEEFWARLQTTSLPPHLIGGALLLLTGGLLASSFSFYVGAVRSARTEQDFLRHLQNLLTTLQDMETGQRGFLLTNETRYLAPYTKGLGIVNSEIGMLRGEAKSDQRLVAQMAPLSVLTRKRISEMQETIRVRREEGDEAARAMVMTGDGLRTMQDIRTIVAQVGSEVSADLVALADKQQQYVGWTWIASAAFGGLLLGWTFTLIATHHMKEAQKTRDASENARKAQESEFRLMADSIPQLAWMADADGMIFWYNRRWLDFTGTTLKQMKRWGWQSIHDPAELPRVLDEWNACIARGDAFEMEFPLRAADGTFRPFLTRVMPLKNEQGALVRWFGTNTDITKRVQAESAAARLAAIIESSEDAIVSKNLSGIVESWNAGAEKLYGYSQAEILGRSMAGLLPSDRAGEEMEILQQIQRGERVRTIESCRVTKHGQTVMVSLTVSPIRNVRGEIVGASHIARDITERKEFESRMQEIQKLESLGVLAGGIAHDFNNLLTGILGNASLAADRIPNGDSGHEFLADVMKAAERAAALTHQLLAYAGKGKFVVEAIDVSEQVGEISRLIESSIPKKVQLRLELGPKLPLIQGDAGQIQQVIMNLLINAAEAIGDSNGVVTLRTWQQLADATYLETFFSDSSLPCGIYVALEVIDTGSGMDEATLSKIFQPFFSTKFAGRGLGLAAVLGIIRSHHGALKVYSTPGQGTSFKILLPVPAEAPVVSLLTEASGSPLPGGGHILVVEDDQAIRKFVKSALEQLGYSVVLASDGQEGVDIFTRTPSAFQLVFMDLTMPGMNGEEAFQRIRLIRPNVPVLLTSGFNSNTAIPRFAGNGLAGFIQKPYTTTQLANKMKEALIASELNS